VFFLGGVVATRVGASHGVCPLTPNPSPQRGEGSKAGRRKTVAMFWPAAGFCTRWPRRFWGHASVPPSARRQHVCLAFQLSRHPACLLEPFELLGK
jgi:hypothetical protein